MKLNEESQAMIKESLNQEVLQTTLQSIQEKLDAKNIFPTELQWTILINHINEMINRSKNSEKIPAVDPLMFSEVSQIALDISRQVVDCVGNLPEDEVYLLSIHFETAKQNE